MFTAEEREQIRQIEDAEYNKRLSTTIKQVDGGYIIEHSIAYVDSLNTVVAQVREQSVCGNALGVEAAISKLYDTADYVPAKPKGLANG